MIKYEISMEIAGPFAMWSRPDTGSTPTSYPVPTWSAAKGIFESVVFYNDGKAWIRPVKVEICKRKGSLRGELFFQKYTTNYHGPLKKKSDPNFQFNALILSDVCYRLYALIENGSGLHLEKGNNPCHALQAMFNRRLQNGQCYKTPSLGWNEFTADYWGPFRDTDIYLEQTEADADINFDMVSVLRQVFDVAVSVASYKYNPRFVQNDNAVIKNGVYRYD